MVGSDVELSCIYPKKNSFDLNDLHVYWQINVTEQSHMGKPHTASLNNTTVVTYYLARNGSAGHKDSHYKDRAHLSLDRMKRGDFSLHLYNITPQDEQKFNCLVFRELEMILKVVVTLHVAANYSMPVVSALSSPEQGEELAFTCTSTNGYPKPNVYWINKTDNSLLDTALQNSTISLNERGLYDVVSILRIRRIPNVNVGCCIENVLLHQNLTVSSQTETVSGTKDSMMESQANTHEKNRAVLSILALLGVAVVVAVAVGWVYRSRCPHSSHTDRISGEQGHLGSPHGACLEPSRPLGPSELPSPALAAGPEHFWFVPAGARQPGRSRNSLVSLPGGKETMLDENSLPSTWTGLL
nr:ICOS ligand isoform X3 [Manis javanica]